MIEAIRVWFCGLLGRNKPVLVNCRCGRIMHLSKFARGIQVLCPACGEWNSVPKE